VQQLGKTPELAGLPRHTLQAIADQLEPRKVAGGQVLYRAGDMAGGLFLIESGRIEIQPDTPDGERQEAADGRLLGALALLTAKPQTTTAVARAETLLWALSAEDFQMIASRQPGLRRSLGRNVRARLSRTDQMQAVLRLSQMPIFTQLPPATIQAIAQRMVLQHVPAGERVYRIGEVGDAMYLVENGEIELTAENAVGVVEEIGRVGPEGFFGELSLLTGQIRVEDATATRNTNLWILIKSELDALAAQNPAIGKALSQGVATRLANAAQTDEQALRRFALLADLNPTDLKQVATLLHPMRYRAGEIIFRASAPADKLYLVEKGNVRVQTLNGGAYLLGPGESFGERALITEQPHNITVSADTDVDVWTLNKPDLDMLMNRYPGIAISITRIISQRMGETPAAPPPGYPAPSAPPPGAPVEAPQPRRRQQAADQEAPRRKRRGFGEWYGSLSAGARLRFILLLLLLMVLLCLTIPFTAATILNTLGAVSRAATAALNNAVDAVYATGSVEVAAANLDTTERMRLADAQVPPTPTYTPFPTTTPLPTFTPTPTNTPEPTATPEPVIVESYAEVAAAAPVEAAPQEPPTPEAVVAAAAAPRNLDGRIAQLGVTIEDAQVAPGQQYWRLIEARWEDEGEAGGKHHIYVDALDENGNRIIGQPITVFWGDGSSTSAVEDKPAPDLGFNYMMYASGYAYNVKVEGLPSDILRGAGMGDIANRFKGIHVAYYLVFQRTTK
jgi:CRP-like cAMP-binding protein